MELLRPMIPPFDAASGWLARPLPARRPTMDERLTMEPPPASIICGMACLLHSITLFRFTSITVSQKSSSTSVTEPGPLMPTLFISTLRLP